MLRSNDTLVLLVPEVTISALPSRSISPIAIANKLAVPDIDTGVVEKVTEVAENAILR